MSGSGSPGSRADSGSSTSIPPGADASPASDNLKPHPRPFLRRLQAYTPGEQPTAGKVIKLNTNELPYPPAPEVIEAIRRAADDSLRLYPSPRCDALRSAIGRKFNLPPESVFVGNGSDEVIRLVIQAYGGRGRLTASVSPTYSLYPTLTQAAEGDYQEYQLDELQHLPAQVFETGWDLFLLCQPNPPLGTLLPHDKIYNLTRPGRMLLLDQAYAEFSDADDKYFYLSRMSPNIVISRTFSKAYGLAGLRIGYLLGAPNVISEIGKLADSYNVNRISQVAALAALEADDYYRERISLIRRDRAWLRDQLQTRGFGVPESHGNFLYARHPQAQRLYEQLKARRILVRYFPHPPLGDGVRISIGTREELDALLAAVDDILS